MNNQEVFDQVVRHLRKQGCQSRENGMCQYRGPEGRKCAAGILIPDSKYRPELEGFRVGDCGISDIFLAQNINLEFLSELQYTHDTFEPTEWESRFVILAKQHNLTVPIP